MQKWYGTPLHLVDESYMFDIVVSDCVSLDELMRLATEAENPPPANPVE